MKPTATSIGLAFACLGLGLALLYYAARVETLERAASIQADREERRLRDMSQRYEGCRDSCRAVLEVRYP